MDFKLTGNRFVDYCAVIGAIFGLARLWAPGETVEIMLGMLGVAICCAPFTVIGGFFEKPLDSGRFAYFLGSGLAFGLVYAFSAYLFSSVLGMPVEWFNFLGGDLQSGILSLVLLMWLVGLGFAFTAAKFNSKAGRRVFDFIGGKRQ